MSGGRGDWLARVRESMVGTWRLIAEGSPGGRAIDREGVFAAVAPVSPNRSVANSVIYSDARAMLGSLDELADAYEEAGVRAWTVWVPEGDDDAARGLERAGHVLDAEPRAMGMELERAKRPEPTEDELVGERDLATVGRVNDAAYGYGEDGLAPLIEALPADRVHAYGADADGETAAVTVAIDFGEDTEIAWVATAEAARGRGLASALMRRALWDARERGQRSATLQATRLGRPVYERAGFADLGALQMWERRRS